MAAVATVVAAIKAELAGDGTICDDHYRADTTKFAVTTTYWQCRAVIAEVGVYGSNDLMQYVTVVLEFYYLLAVGAGDATYAHVAAMFDVQKKWLRESTWKGVTGIHSIPEEGTPESGEVERTGNVIHFQITTTISVVAD